MLYRASKPSDRSSPKWCMDLKLLRADGNPAAQCEYSYDQHTCSPLGSLRAWGEGGPRCILRYSA